MIRERIALFLRAASARGDLSIPDPALAASQFMQLISVDIPLTGLLGLGALTTDRVTVTIESGLALFLKGYRPPPRVATPTR